MSFTPTRICGYCCQEKPHKWNGQKLKDGSKVYLDEKEQRWSGRRCPDCERKRVSAAIHCDSFERSVVIDQLRRDGYETINETLPLRVQKDGEIFSVGVKHARTEKGRIIIEEKKYADADLYALIFANARILPQDQFEKLRPNIDFVKAPRAKKNSHIFSSQNSVELHSL